MSIIIVITSAANLGNSYRLSKMSIIIAAIIVIFIVVTIVNTIKPSSSSSPQPYYAPSHVDRVLRSLWWAAFSYRLRCDATWALKYHCCCCCCWSLFIIVWLIDCLLWLVRARPLLITARNKFTLSMWISWSWQKNISSRCKITHPVRDKSMTISIKKTRIAKLIVTPHLGSAVRRTESSLLQVLMKGPHNSQRPSREARDWSSYDIINDIIMMWVWYRSCSKILTKNDRNHLTLQ